MTVNIRTLSLKCIYYLCLAFRSSGNYNVSESVSISVFRWKQNRRGDKRWTTYSRYFQSVVVSSILNS